MSKVIVSVVFNNPAVQSVQVEQWRRPIEGQIDRTPQIIANATQDAFGEGSGEWVTDLFRVKNPGNNNKLHLRVVAYDGPPSTGSKLAVIAIPPRRHPKPNRRP